MVNLQEIENAFNIPAITSETVLTKGKTATTCLLQTNTPKQFILKSIDTKDQASFEYQLMQHIRTKDEKIVSEIFTTKSCEPFIQIDQNLYQLQGYIPTVNEKAPLHNVLMTYQKLQQYLEDFQYELARPNRFALDELWMETKDLLYDQPQEIYNEVCPSIEVLQALDRNQENWIHGDLGAWNILYTTEGNVCFIDFSDVRKGPRYFDLAAIFASYLPQDLTVFEMYAKQFLSELDAPINLQEFYQTLELWYSKGILSLLKLKIPSVKEHILNFYHIIKYIRAL